MKYRDAWSGSWRFTDWPHRSLRIPPRVDLLRSHHSNFQIPNFHGEPVRLEAVPVDYLYLISAPWSGISSRCLLWKLAPGQLLFKKFPM